jgi:hypothetical protein
MLLHRRLLIVLWLSIVALSLSACLEGLPELPIPGTAGPQIVSHSGYLVSEMGLTYRVVVGEVQNTGTTNVGFVKLRATFYDSDGQVYASDEAYAQAKVLLPEQKSPFTLTSYTGTEVEQYTLELAEFRETDIQPHTDFEILSHSSEVDDQDYYHVIGELKNTGATDTTSTEIVATFYGADGKVVAVGLLGTAVGTIGPGQTVSFDVQAYPHEATSQIASYVLQAQEGGSLYGIEGQR